MAGKPGCNCLSVAGDRGWQARTAPTETDCVADDAVSYEPVSAANSLLYRVYATTRKSSGEMIRKLSVIRSRKRSHFLGTVRLRKRRIADLNWAKVS